MASENTSPNGSALVRGRAAALRLAGRRDFRRNAMRPSPGCPPVRGPPDHEAAVR